MRGINDKPDTEWRNKCARYYIMVEFFPIDKIFDIDGKQTLVPSAIEGQERGFLNSWPYSIADLSNVNQPFSKPEYLQHSAHFGGNLLDSHIHMPV